MLNIGIEISFIFVGSYDRLSLYSCITQYVSMLLFEGTLDNVTTMKPPVFPS